MDSTNLVTGSLPLSPYREAGCSCITIRTIKHDIFEKERRLQDMRVYSRIFVLLLLFRHSAKSSNAQEERLATPPVVILTSPHSRYLSSSLSLSVGFSTQDEAMDVAPSAPQVAHYRAFVAARWRDAGA